MFQLRLTFWQQGGVKKLLSDIGEDALVQKLCQTLPSDALVGPGDDCAVVDLGKRDWYQLLKTDTIVEHVHFLPDADAAKVGWKAVARVISDFAAMGGTAAHLLVSISVRDNTEVNYLTKLYRGMVKCATSHRASISGGETTSVPEGGAHVVTVSGTGRVSKKHLALRSGAKRGDGIYVTGRLGGSISGKHLSFTPRVLESQWLVSDAKPSAMMDLSDGLGKDLPRLTRSSECGFLIDETLIPRTRGCSIQEAISDGEDYELLLTIPRKREVGLLERWKEVGMKTKLTRIGEVTADGGEITSGGWDHFKG